MYPKRFESIDGLRGLAALAVVIGHVWHIEPLGAAAVLVFFVISGYCVTAAADAGLHAGVGLGTYMWRRVRRIYPPYLLSVAFFAVTRFARDWFAPRADVGPFSPDAADWALNATLTQWVMLVPHPAGWPHENPSLFVSVYWSLCYEEQFYVVVGLATFLLAAWRAWLAVALTTFAVGWIVAFPDRCFGWFVEYWPMFAIGGIVYFRLCRMTSRRARWITDFGLGAVGVAAFALAQTVGTDGDTGAGWWGWNGCAMHRNAFGDMAIASAFGLFLVAIRRGDAWYLGSRWLSAPLGLLGAISYSLYLTHNFNLRITESVARAIAGSLGLGSSGAWVGVIQVVGLVAVAIAFYFVAERPFLNRPLRQRTASRGTQAAGKPTEGSGPTDPSTSSYERSER